MAVDPIADQKEETMARTNKSWREAVWAPLSQMLRWFPGTDGEDDFLMRTIEMN
jgi:hypothetical protein